MPIPNYISFRSYDKPPLSPYRTSFEKKKKGRRTLRNHHKVGASFSLCGICLGGGAASRALGFKY